MMRFKLIAFAFLCTQAVLAQVTFRVVSLPSNTPANANIYIAGSFNGWAEGNANYQLNTLIDGDPSITLPVSGTITCKFTRGSWASVEGNATGGFLPDRQFQVAPLDTLLISILSWEDLGSSGSGSTALSSVSLLSDAFFMPLLNRSRRIWICLPSDYSNQPDKRYRTVYMHDGQNLFDDALAFAGEWGVDETMRNLQLSGDEGAIVIGIENGGSLRISEYTPWENPTYGGGEGEAYADFIRNTLKPYVDATYRTKPEAEHTAIAGSSLGALIALYTAARYPESFGKVGLLSPAFWINRDSLQHWLSTRNLPATQRHYFVAGTTESSTMMSDIQWVRNSLSISGVASENLNVVSKIDGAHSEWFWRREFPDAYLWLFGQSALNTSSSPDAFRLYPNPADSGITLCPRDGQPFRYWVSTLDGRVVYREMQSLSCAEIALQHLPQGLYLVWAGKADATAQPYRILKN